MPTVFLSPSLQTGNPYVTGGNEGTVMNLLADALEPYLTRNNIGYTRSRLPGSLENAIAASNKGAYNLHLALHSNASPEGKEGRFQGVQTYYYLTSPAGKKAAEDLTNAMKQVYLDPDLVYPVPTGTVTEIRQTKAPAVLMEIGYHDNREDALWLTSHLQDIAAAIAKGLCTYFGLPFRDVCAQRGEPLTRAKATAGTYVAVCTGNAALNLRREPSTQGARVGQVPGGKTVLLVENPSGNWAKVRYNTVTGYAMKEYLCVCAGDERQESGRVTTRGGNLNLRRAASLSSPVIGRIPDGDTVLILGKEGSWYRVSYRGATGYVLSDFVTV